MSKAWRFATIDSFVKVPVARGTMLLRVAATTSAAADGDDVRPTLVADNGHTVSSFAAIPAPADTGATLRAAYAVPEETASDAVVFSLEFDDFFVIALPSATAGSGRAETPGAAGTAASAPTVEVDEDRRETLAPKITELSEELGETRLESFELRTAVETAQSEERQLRDQLRALRISAAVTAAELQAGGELAAFGAGASAPAASVPAAGDAELVRSLQDRLAAAESEAHAATERASELEIWTGELERRLTDATTELAEARTAAPAGEAPLFEGLPGELGAEAQETHAAAMPTDAYAADADAVEQIRRAAVDDAHAQAERDLAAAGG